MTKMMKRTPYEAPKLTAVSFKAEHGYAASLVNFDDLILLELDAGENPTGNHVEAYQQSGPSGNHWDFGSDNFWNY
jgi:hypothetical protein